VLRLYVWHVVLTRVRYERKMGAYRISSH
jgi:hypothetical protein